MSIESPEPEIHDLLTARPGSFRATLEGIRCLQKAGISVQTNTTVTATNAPDAPRMPRFLKGIGVSRFAMNLYLPPGTDRELPARTRKGFSYLTRAPGRSSRASARRRAPRE